MRPPLLPLVALVARAAREKFGGLDVLINNAGVFLAEEFKVSVKDVTSFVLGGRASAFERAQYMRAVKSLQHVMSRG